jgi:hypothetical protein
VLLKIIFLIISHYTFDIFNFFGTANIEQRNQNTKFVLIDLFEVTAWIVSAKILAIESTFIFSELFTNGTESVTTSSSIAESLILSTALPESIGCVANALILLAPLSFIISAARTRVDYYYIPPFNFSNN